VSGRSVTHAVFAKPHTHTGDIFAYYTIDSMPNPWPQQP
jgi:hypothetical protein